MPVREYEIILGGGGGGGATFSHPDLYASHLQIDFPKEFKCFASVALSQLCLLEQCRCRTQWLNQLSEFEAGLSVWSTSGMSLGRGLSVLTSNGV